MATVFIILTFLLAVVYFSFLILCLYGWKKTVVSYATTQPDISVSIVVAARNEAENIKACIEAALQQHYPSDLIQLIVVDDASTDDTYDIAQSLQKQYHNLIVIKSKPLEHHNTSFKKNALQQGIDFANGTLIVTHDADCVAQPDWIATIVNCYKNTHAKAIAMPISFGKGSGLLYEFQQQDIAGLMAITAGSLYFNIPLMANAANMAFEKTAFQQVNGFSGNENVPGGDDIYLLLKIKKAFSATSIFFLKDKKAVVTTKPCNTFSAFFNQRIRWMSKTGKFNNAIITGILMISYLFNFLLLGVSIAGIINLNADLLFTAGILYLIKWVIEYYLVSAGAKLLMQRFSIMQFLVNNFMHQCYVIILGTLSKFISFKWKDRKY